MPATKGGSAVRGRSLVGALFTDSTGSLRAAVHAHGKRFRHTEELSDDRMLEAALGPVRFAALYLIAGFGGNVVTYLFSAQNQESAGASTAIFGLFLAAVVINRRLGLQIAQLIPILVINLIITFTILGCWTGE